MPNSQHVPLTKFRLSGWASEIVTQFPPSFPNVLLTGHFRELAEAESRIPHPRHCSSTGRSHRRNQQSLAVAPGPVSLPTQRPQLLPWILLQLCSLSWPRWLRRYWPSNLSRSPALQSLQLLITDTNGRLTPPHLPLVHPSVPAVSANIRCPFIVSRLHHHHLMNPLHCLRQSMSLRAASSHSGNLRASPITWSNLWSRTFPLSDIRRMFSQTTTSAMNGLEWFLVSLRVLFLHSASSLVDGGLSWRQRKPAWQSRHRFNFGDDPDT